jgi:hypothetical protein
MEGVPPSLQQLVGAVRHPAVGSERRQDPLARGSHPPLHTPRDRRFDALAVTENATVRLGVRRLPSSAPVEAPVALASDAPPASDTGP